MKDVIEAPASDVALSNRPLPNGFLRRLRQGRVKLWQALLLHLIGFPLMVLLTVILDFLVGLPLALEAVLIGGYGTFSAVVLWRSSPGFRESVAGALAKLWSVLFVLYLISFCVSFFLSQFG